MTRGATGLPETSCGRNFRRAKQAMGEELTERKQEKRKERREVWGEGGVGKELSCPQRVLLCDLADLARLGALAPLIGSVVLGRVQYYYIWQSVFVGM
jgi:hypothetical protein